MKKLRKNAMIQIISRDECKQLALGVMKRSGEDTTFRMREMYEDVSPRNELHDECALFSFQMKLLHSINSP